MNICRYSESEQISNGEVDLTKSQPSVYSGKVSQIFTELSLPGKMLRN